MPIHDWTRVRANRFHHFHQDWITELARALNRGVLPPGYFAAREQITGGPEPDVVALALPGGPHPAAAAGGLAVADAPPPGQIRAEAEAILYARKSDHVVIRHPDGDMVAVIEIVSPGNKDSKHAIRTFTRKAAEFLFAGINLLVVDLFPPSKRDPKGIHKAIWDRIRDEPFDPPAGKPLTVAAYSAGTPLRAYVEPVGVGDELPDSPIFLTPDRYVPCPLESTYRATWDGFPAPYKDGLETPA